MSLSVADSESACASMEDLSLQRNPCLAVAANCGAPAARSRSLGIEDDPDESAPARDAASPVARGNVVTADFTNYGRDVARCGNPLPEGAPNFGLRNDFFSRIRCDQPFRQLFEHIPGVLFFAKDAQSRLMCGSRALLERLGVGSESDLIGRSDHDFFPRHVAERYIADDQAVQRTGEPLIDRVELWYSEQHLLDWFVTTKLPLFDRQGRPFGVMGIMRSYEGKRKALAVCSNLLRVIDYISAHLDGSLPLADLAKTGGMSERQLQRKFRAVYRMSVQQFVIKTRIQHAAKAVLNSDRSLSAIASEFGFCDQSAFTRHFRLHTGLSPLKFRRQFWK